MIVYAVLIFPIFPRIYAFVDFKEFTLKITVTVLGLNVFNVTVKAVGGNVLIKRTFKKEYRLKMKDGVKKGKMPKICGITLLSYNSLTVIGAEDAIGVTVVAGFINTVKNAVFPIIKAVKPVIDYNSVICVKEDENRLLYAVKAVILLNALTVINILIKKGINKR